MKKITIFFVIFAAFAAVEASRHHYGKRSLLHEARELPSMWTLAQGSAVNAEEVLTVHIGLHRRNIEEVRQRLHVVSDPRQPTYGEYLTPEELSRLVAPEQKSVELVAKWLRHYGVGQLKVSGFNDVISFEAPVAALQRMFGVQFSVYSHLKTGKKVARSLHAVTIPQHLTSVVEVVSGFRAFPVEMALSRHPVKVASPSDNISPQVIWTTYNVTNFPTPNSQNAQAFFQAQGQYVSSSDLNMFCKKYVPSANCTVAKYVGKNTPGEPGIESSLDSQYIIGVNKAQVETWVFSYPNFDFCADLIKWGTDVLSLNGTHRPFVISMSYGTQGLPNMCAGADVPRLSNDIMLMGSIGITVLLASGDDGSGQYSREGYNNGKLNPSWPASIPYCVAVGSTTFITGNSGAEMATDEFGSGGGFSFDYNTTSQFSWQTAAVNAYFSSGVPLPASKMYPRGGRATPDVAALGWNFNVADGGSFTQVGGTSASTPTFASLVSMLNNERLKVGKTLGFLNPFLYQNTGAFIDVLKGTNAIDPSKIGWQCAKGWDPVTGLGTPNFGKMLSLVQALNARDLANRA